MEKPDDVLTTADLLFGLNEEESAILIARGHRIKCLRGEVVMESGEAGAHLCVILRGQVEVVKGTGPHEDVLVVLGAGQGFGEMALLDAGPRSATVRCISEEADLWCISSEALLTFCKGAPAVGYQLMYNLARDLAFKLRHRNLPRTSDSEVRR
mgnify:CR=1 FL=1